MLLPVYGLVNSSSYNIFHKKLWILPVNCLGTSDGGIGHFQRFATTRQALRVSCSVCSAAMSESEVLVNDAVPRTSATITIRIIKSFEYRVEKSLVLHNINLEQLTARQLKELVRQDLQIKSGFKAFRSIDLDTLKIYTKAHGSKTSNLIINLDHDDELMLNDDEATLADLGIENETEISFFNGAAYRAYQKKPEVKWN